MAVADILSIEWGECLLKPQPVPKELEAEIRHRLGAIPNWLPLIADVPWLAKANAAMKPVTHVPRHLSDLVVLVVSQDNSCRFCYGLIRTFLKLQGYSDDYVRRLEQDFQSPDLAPRDRQLLAYVRQISRNNPRPSPGEHEALLKAGFTAIQVAELVFIAAYTAFQNRVATMLAYPPAESLESLTRVPLFGLLRPLINWGISRSLNRPLPPPLGPDEGPATTVIAALRGSPAGTLLREMVDGAMASPVLPVRTKMLMFAVVGKALGCPFCQEAAPRYLAGEGWSPEELEEVLAHLASPRLDEREALLVPFARETVRYNYATLQQLTRELSLHLGREELIEAVGMVSLANMIARMSVLLEAC